MFRRQNLGQQILRMVGILIFIYHDVVKLILVFSTNFFIFLEKFQSQKQQVVEVKSVVLLQLRFITSVDFCNLAIIKITSLFSVIFRSLQLVFSITNATNHRRRLIAFFVKIHLLQNLLHQTFSISSVINGKIISVVI